MSVQPDLILQLAQHIARDFEAEGKGPVEVHADTRVSLNGRPAELARGSRGGSGTAGGGVARKSWILPTPDSTPARLRPALAQGDRSCRRIPQRSAARGGAAFADAHDSVVRVHGAR